MEQVRGLLYIPLLTTIASFDVTFAFAVRYTRAEGYRIHRKKIKRSYNANEQNCNTHVEEKTKRSKKSAT